MNKQKSLGQVYTPQWIVETILDLVGYNNEDVLEKYIIEPSCGDGVFLLEIVQRYINISIKLGWKQEKIVMGIEKYIVGVELDSVEHFKSIENLNNLVKRLLGASIKIHWSVYNENTFKFYKKNLNKFDFVIGNPPYIRIHNLDEETKLTIKREFVFNSGTIDIYLSFFEMGLKLLNNTGKLGYITPNSFLHNSSYLNFRNYLKVNKLVETLIDFKANKLFKGISTYTAISVINKFSTKNHFDYNEFIDGKISKINTIYFNQVGNKDWSFSNTADAAFISCLHEGLNESVKNYFDVQYGFATLRDKIFIGDIGEAEKNLVKFNGFLIEKNILKKIVKGSTFKGNQDEVKYILFPYFLAGKRYLPLSEEMLKADFPNAYLYLLSQKEELLRRDLDKGSQWFEFGRSQGIQNIHNEKVVLSTLANGKIKFFRLPEDVLVYSGIFIVKNKSNVDWSIIEDILISNEFYRYIRITGKDFSGGYKSITSKQIKEYKIPRANPYLLFNQNEKFSNDRY